MSGLLGRYSASAKVSLTTEEIFLLIEAIDAVYRTLEDEEDENSVKANSVKASLNKIKAKLTKAEAG